MVANVGAKLDALGSVVEHITLGEVEVPPLPRGEPGGKVIGKGKDIQGVFRFTLYVIAFRIGGQTRLRLTRFPSG
jgi:hypothetical protein